MRNPSKYAAKLLLMAVLAGLSLAVACSSAEEPKPAAAPASAPAAPTAAPAIVAQPAPTEAKTALEFTDGKRGGNMRIATGV